MPIYEYTCRKCKAHIESLQKITDKPLTKCRTCGGRLEKQWSSTSFQLKGTGWYVTDYAGKKSDAGEEKKSAAGGVEEKKSATGEPAATNEKAAQKETPAAKKSGPAKATPSNGD